ncbi:MULTISPECIES: YjzD family protein [Lacticaseibacillus]|uniref:YjzD family protein n=2 Tax=Lacticaseibacillus TaxID=2759736 RepID=A0ABW4CDI9_9LACO|nr:MULTISPECIES: YjzD family protein [Lacticaseibacillus]
MRYIVTLFWGILLGQVTGFLVSALGGSSFDMKSSFIFSIIFVLILFLLPPIMEHFAPQPAKEKKD